jgi:hypothetical protein
MNPKYLILSALLGGLVIFIWGAVYHAAIGIDMHTMKEFRDSTAVSAFVREHADGNGMFYTKDGVLAAVSVTPGMSDKSQHMGPLLGKQLVINVVVAGLLAWLLTFTGIRTPLCAAGLFALTGLAAGISCSISAWNWYNHSMAFALASVVDLAVGFLLAGLVIGWARGKFAPAVAAS